MARFFVFVFLLLVSQCFAGAYKRQTRQEQVASNPSYDEINSMTFDISLLRPQDVPDTVVVSEALKAMEDLNHKQFCHKLSASMLLDNCRVTRQLSEADQIRFSKGEQERREKYLKIFAVALTICDMEALHRPIPSQCAPYGQAALMDIKNQGHSRAITLDQKEMDSCMTEIGVDQSSIVVWKINANSASVICQVSRMDIEKDETIGLFLQLSRLMSDHVNKSEELLNMTRESYRQAQAAHEAMAKFKNDAADVKATVVEVQNSVDNVKYGLLDMWSDITTEAARTKDSVAEGVTEIFASFATYKLDLESLMLKLHKNALDNHAEQAAAQNELAIRTDVTRMEMNDIIVVMSEIASKVNAVARGFDNLDRKHTRIESAVTNLTEQLSEATEIGGANIVNLLKASATAANLMQILEQSASSANTWQAQILAGNGPFGVGWLLFIATPVGTVLVGSHKRKLSILQTFSLAALGLPLAIFISMSCELNWRALMADYTAPRPQMAVPTPNMEHLVVQT